LTHISSTSSGVALPNTTPGGSGEGGGALIQQTNSPPSPSPLRQHHHHHHHHHLHQGMSRIERHQRATLRRNEAFEEDDHITSVSNSTTELLSTALSIPRHNLPNSNNNNSSSFDDDDNSFSKAITAAQILGASQTNFPNQPLPAPVPLSINNSLNESALRLFLQQQQIKQEPCKIVFFFFFSTFLFLL
jgi:hypothetical protein